MATLAMATLAMATLAMATLAMATLTMATLAMATLAMATLYGSTHYGHLGLPRVSEVDALLGAAAHAVGRIGHSHAAVDELDEQRLVSNLAR